MARWLFICSGEHDSEYVFEKKKTKKTTTKKKKTLAILWVIGSLIKLHKKKTSHNMNEREAVENLTFFWSRKSSENMNWSPVASG